jgi:class 3 adenylate cyclase
VYLDTARGDLSGSAANMATRISDLAPPGAVVVSDAVETLIRNDFELEARPPVVVKGLKEPIIHYRVVGERVPVA